MASGWLSGHQETLPSTINHIFQYDFSYITLGKPVKNSELKSSLNTNMHKMNLCSFSSLNLLNPHLSISLSEKKDQEKLLHSFNNSSFQNFYIYPSIALFPSSSRHPSYIPNFPPYFHNPLSPISAVCLCTCVGPYTRIRASCQKSLF